VVHLAGMRVSADCFCRLMRGKDGVSPPSRHKRQLVKEGNTD
jgi:hypothetical protein